MDQSILSNPYKSTKGRAQIPTTESKGETLKKVRQSYLIKMAMQSKREMPLMDSSDDESMQFEFSKNSNG